jgi:hypothetical protein
LERQQSIADRDWWIRILRESFGRTFWLFLALAVVMAAICYVMLGPEVFDSAVARDKQLLANTLPRLAAAQVVAGLIWVMLPRDRFSRLIGSNSGHRGLAIATVVMVTYITSWALLAAQRIIVWDIPLMGIEFSSLRFLVSLPLPMLAGLLARRLPVSLSLTTDSSAEAVRR